ncbi:MAG: helix-turn-helix domain-containing protein [Candidatus Brocadiales bacterium]|nr:helix-turn-helix domain-containing protein [Candidatus Bathyanammoxibius sp.]
MKRNGWLTPKKLRAVNSLVECSTVEEASREVGVSRSTLYEWLKVPSEGSTLPPEGGLGYVTGVESKVGLLPIRGNPSPNKGQA